jgi:peroxiredoxin
MGGHPYDPLEVVAVNVGADAGGTRAFLEEFQPKLTFTIVLDSAGEAFQAWGVRGLPKTFVTDKRGRFIYGAEGDVT